MFLDLSKYINSQSDDYKEILIDLNSINRVSTYTTDEDVYRICIHTKNDHEYEIIRLDFLEVEDRDIVLQELKDKITKGRFIF